MVEKYESLYESDDYVVIDFVTPKDFKNFLNLMKKYGYDSAWEYDKSSSFKGKEQYVKMPRLVYTKMSRMFKKFGVNYFEV